MSYIIAVKSGQKGADEARQSEFLSLAFKERVSSLKALFVFYSRSCTHGGTVNQEGIFHASTCSNKENTEGREYLHIERSSVVAFVHVLYSIVQEENSILVPSAFLIACTQTRNDLFVVIHSAGEVRSYYVCPDVLHALKIFPNRHTNTFCFF